MSVEGGVTRGRELTDRSAREGCGSSRDGNGRRGDRGSAAVWVVFALAGLCAVFGALLLAGHAVVVRHRAAAAADLAALAAADRWTEGGGSACDTAGRVARAQGARLVRCGIEGEVSDVTAASGRAPFTVRVRARAGPRGPARRLPGRRHRPGISLRGAPFRTAHRRAPARRALTRGAPAHRARARRVLAHRAPAGRASARRVPDRRAAVPRCSSQKFGQQPYGTSLVQRFVAVAALGGLDAGRAAGLALAGGDGLARGGEPLACGVEGPLGEPGAAGMAVVHEDRGQQGVGMERDGDPADVPAVARGEQREQTDGRVLGGVQGAAQVLRVDPGRVELVLGDRPPHRAGAQRTRREVELGLAQHLAGEDAAAQVGDDLVRHLDGAVAEAALAPGDLDVLLQYGDRRGVAGDGGVRRVGSLDQGDGVLQVERAHQVGAALVEVDRALVHTGVGGARVDRAEQPSGALLHDLHRPSALAADVGEVGGAFPAGPVPGLRTAAQEAGVLELGHQGSAGGAEEREVLLGQRQFGGGGAQVRGEDVGVVGVEDGGLDGLVEEGLGMVDEEGVQRVVAGDQHRQGALSGAARPARLLPERGPGARVAGDQHGVEAGDVDAQLQGGGGGEAEEFAGVQRAFQGAAFLGEVAAAVGGDTPGERAVDLGQPLLGDERDQLGTAPGADEGDRAHVLHDEVGQQIGGLGGGGAADGGALLAVQLGERGLPEGEHQFTAGRGVVRHLDHGQPGQPARGHRRVGGGGRGEQEDGGGAVAGAQPAQPPQHLGDVRAEDATVGVALVDDHVLQGAQEGGPARVGGQDPAMQHVGVGEDVVGVLTYPFAFLGRGVAVVHGGPHGRAQGLGEFPHRPPLVGRECLGGGQVQGGGAPAVGRLGAVQEAGEHGHEVGQGLAGGGTGGDHDRVAVQRVFGGQCLMGPGVFDAALAHGGEHLRANPVRPDGMAALPRGQVLRMSDARSPARPGGEPVQHNARRGPLCGARRGSIGSVILGHRSRVCHRRDGQWTQGVVHACR
ncbi:flp pilus-assembly TadE/G-like family protein [Streptomyces sp. C1-2]|nr:flp pilus-assembly TadE/G-like family protein [Streptomyces sp. C1-2]